MESHNQNSQNVIMSVGRWNLYCPRTWHRATVHIHTCACCGREPRTPNQCWRGQYLFHSAGVPMWPHFNTDSGVEGGQTSRTSCCGDLENLTFFRAIFLPSTVPIRLSNGGTEWDKDMHDVSFWRHAHATTMMLPSLQFICHSCRASLSWNIDKGEI